MLDVMRRKKGLTKVVISIAVVGIAGTFGFALYGVWGGALTGTAQGAPNWIALVDGEQVPTRPFQQRRAQLVEDFKDRFAGQGLDDEQLLRLAEEQALWSLIYQQLASQEAEKVGLRVTDSEVRDVILNDPMFRQGGRFVGVDRYRNFLRAQGLDSSEFEAGIAQRLAADKVLQAVVPLAEVSGEDLERRFRDEVERLDVDYVLLADADYTEAKAPSESALRKHFGEHASDYMTPEKRRVAYVLFDREAKAQSVEILEDEILDSYERNKSSLYSHGEQRRASHILLRVPPDASADEEEAIHVSAGEIHVRIGAGEDFAELARQHSEDPGSAPAGGDLGHFERGRMVKEFEDVAFSLSPGEVSEVFKSAFGYHIVKITDERPAGTQPLEEVRDEIRRGLAVRKAHEEIRKDADECTSRFAAQESSFQGTAASLGHEVSEFGFFARGEPIEGLGRLPQADDAIFSLVETGDVTPPVAVGQGLAVFQLQETRRPEPAPLEDVRDRVVEDLKTARARERAEAAAERLLAAKGSLRERAERRDLELENHAAVIRGQPLPPLTNAAKAAAFAAPVGAVLGPFASEDGLVVLQVNGKSPSTPQQEVMERQVLRERLLAEERATLYETFMTRLRNSANIQINEALLRGGGQGR
jgi:peptidyl-prolyl cis-trans isomerase D